MQTRHPTFNGYADDFFPEVIHKIRSIFNDLNSIIFKYNDISIIFHIKAKIHAYESGCKNYEYFKV